jgi:hypothetical protein
MDGNGPYPTDLEVEQKDGAMNPNLTSTSDQ